MGKRIFINDSRSKNLIRKEFQRGIYVQSERKISPALHSADLKTQILDL